MPDLSISDKFDVLRSLKLGKYSEVISVFFMIIGIVITQSVIPICLAIQWFNDVKSSDISAKCEEVLSTLSSNYGCQVSYSCVLLFLEIITGIIIFVIDHIRAMSENLLSLPSFPDF